MPRKSGLIPLSLRVFFKTEPQKLDKIDQLVREAMLGEILVAYDKFHLTFDGSYSVIRPYEKTEDMAAIAERIKSLLLQEGCEVEEHYLS